MDRGDFIPQNLSAIMKELSENFGVLIAFLLPGFLVVWGLSFSFDEIATWLANSNADGSPTVGGFLYATLASLSLGLLTSAIRWAIIDHLMNFCGVDETEINYANLGDEHRYTAFVGAIENHYRYYQYYANTLTALLMVYAVYCIVGAGELMSWLTLIVLAVTVILFLGGRDALIKFYDKARNILR